MWRASARPTPAPISRLPETRFRSRPRLARRLRALPATSAQPLSIVTASRRKVADRSTICAPRSSRGGHELREEGAVEEERLRVRQRDEEGPHIDGTGRSRLGPGAGEVYCGRPPLRDAEIDEVGDAHPANQLERGAERAQQLGHAESGQCELHDHGRAGSGHGQEAVARAIGHAVGDDQGHVRARDQHQHGDGRRKGEEDGSVDHRGSPGWQAGGSPKRKPRRIRWRGFEGSAGSEGLGRQVTNRHVSTPDLVRTRERRRQTMATLLLRRGGHAGPWLRCMIQQPAPVNGRPALPKCAQSPREPPKSRPQDCAPCSLSRPSPALQHPCR